MRKTPTDVAPALIGAVGAGLLALAALVPGSANAADDLARFDGGIGVVPVTVPAIPNDVNGVQPGGRPWVIADFKATVRSNGRIRADGRGLLLGGGGGVGTTGGQSVKAIFFCNGVRSETTATGVPLEPNGDFRIDDQLVPAPMGPCNTSVLLITNPQDRWFAAGIPK